MEEILGLEEALGLLESIEERKAFLKDLCTPQEITAMRERWRVCQLLHQGAHSYREIHALTGASLVTISRVARFLKTEDWGGYRTLLERLARESKKENE